MKRFVALAVLVLVVRVAGAQRAAGQPDPGGTPSAQRAPAASARPSASPSPARDSARRPRRPPPPREARPDRTAVRTMASSPSPQVLSRRDAAEMWRARLLAIAALLLALVIFVVILTAK